MAEKHRTFRSGEAVSKPGEYRSHQGERRSYQQGETFARCSRTGEETEWIINYDDRGCC
ncbi:hypothetical protein [Mechercharimyces sp. CAU 1602]|uniref:hypothetical protein n=1 Tax=Mechercharimyces sp. CAU 1602 TaxID=2973933 RepID=UPI002162993D|nr:hypothetical protein [Mechercharimyces sp. CAU 1602]MCS1350695.1 hypothetical protein [Mechercharimyces sp. CAU 1602]